MSKDDWQKLFRSWHHYILDENKVAVPVDLLTWARWFETAERHVARTELPGEVVVSTVFLGLDHSFGRGPRDIFETMVFGGPHDGTTDRYATWKQAEAGHRRIVREVVGEGEIGVGGLAVDLGLYPFTEPSASAPPETPPAPPDPAGTPPPAIDANK